VIAARESGAAVIIGDAARVEVLERARLRFAKHIVIVAGDDANNVEIAAQARALASQAGRILSCSTQIQNPELWYALRSWDVGTGDGFAWSSSTSRSSPHARSSQSSRRSHRSSGSATCRRTS
jgi:hypothetical protein